MISFPTTMRMSLGMAAYIPATDSATHSQIRENISNMQLFSYTDKCESSQIIYLSKRSLTPLKYSITSLIHNKMYLKYQKQMFMQNRPCYYYYIIIFSDGM